MRPSIQPTDHNTHHGRDTQPRYRFCVIGGGLTATALLCQLVDKLNDMGDEGRRLGKGLRVEIFEKQEVIGPGLPHNERFVLPFHITNMCAGDMTVRAARPADFQQWVLRNKQTLAGFLYDPKEVFTGPGTDSTKCHHYPRAVMGEYLKSQVQTAADMAENLGMATLLHTGFEVTDIHEEKSKAYLACRNNSGTLQTFGPFHGVLLATGHWFESADQQNYFSSPWPAAKLLEAIPSGAEIGVLGSSLSAIEVALTLTSDGRFKRQLSGELIYAPPRSPRKLTLYSRRGLLPRVRGRIGSRPNRYLSCERLLRLTHENPYQLKLTDIFELLDRELSAAYGYRVDWSKVLDPVEDPERILRLDINKSQTGDGPDGELIWQTALVEIYPVVRELYIHLRPDERQRFERDFSTLFFSYAATQPIINGEKLLALMQAGVVSVVRLGRDYGFGRNETMGAFELSYEDLKGERRWDTYRYVVNARGQPRSVASDKSELTRNLLRRGLIKLEETVTGGAAHSLSSRTGSILVDPDTHRLLPPTGQKGAAGIDLFAVGAMTRGQIIDASMAYGLARSTATVADCLINRLGRVVD